MEVTVHYFAQLKRAAGMDRETVVVAQASTVAQLVQHLAQRHDESFRAMILDAAGEPQRALLYAVGDEQVSLQQVLRDDDQVTIVAPMAGG